jgi:hypothetical protein
MHEISQSRITPFSGTTENEVIKKDKKLIGKIMMLDWRDRPTAEELLRDEWFEEDGEWGSLSYKSILLASGSIGECLNSIEKEISLIDLMQSSQ